MFDAAWKKTKWLKSIQAHWLAFFRSRHFLGAYVWVFYFFKRAAGVFLFLVRVFSSLTNTVISEMRCINMRNGDQKLSHKQMLTSILIIISFRNMVLLLLFRCFQMDHRPTDWMDWQPDMLGFFSLFFTWYIYAKSSAHASWTFCSSIWRQYIINTKHKLCCARLMNFVRYLLVAFLSNKLKFLSKQSFWFR